MASMEEALRGALDEELRADPHFQLPAAHVRCIYTRALA